VGISPRAFRRSLPATREAAERAGAPHEP
jgi:hypothetical protein